MEPQLLQIMYAGIKEFGSDAEIFAEIERQKRLNLEGIEVRTDGLPHLYDCKYDSHGLCCGVPDDEFCSRDSVNCNIYYPKMEARLD